VKTYRVDHGRCPICSKILTASTSASKTPRAPASGDLTVCIDCLTWLTYNDDMTLRTISQKDIDDMSDERARELRELTLSL
jgi:hypothetical protein